jgi:hypothetical protein
VWRLLRRLVVKPRCNDRPRAGIAYAFANVPLFFNLATLSQRRLRRLSRETISCATSAADVRGRLARGSGKCNGVDRVGSRGRPGLLQATQSSSTRLGNGRPTVPRNGTRGDWWVKAESDRPNGLWGAPQAARLPPPPPTPLSATSAPRRSGARPAFASRPTRRARR